MTLRTFVLATLASATLTGSVLADDRTYLTPPLYREQARATAAIRPASELTTTPSVTAAATSADTALVDDRTYLTPPLYRMQARATAAVRPASELTTTPSVTPRAVPTRRVVAEAIERTAR